MKYKATHIVNLNNSPKEAWDKLKDLSLASCYVPGVKSVKFITDEKEGVGVVRMVYPQKMEESVIVWETHREILLQLSKNGRKGFFPFKEAVFRYQISGENNAEMKLSLEYNPMLNAFGYLLFGCIIQKRISKTAESLKEFYNKK